MACLHLNYVFNFSLCFAHRRSAPCVQAALMLMITMFARQTGRTGDGLQALCTSGMILLFPDPVAFSLSFNFPLPPRLGFFSLHRACKPILAACRRLWPILWL